MIFDRNSQKHCLKKYLLQPEEDPLNAYVVNAFLEKTKFIKKKVNKALFLGKYPIFQLLPLTSSFPGKAFLEFPEILPSLPPEIQDFYLTQPPEKEAYDLILHNNLHQENLLENSIQLISESLKPQGIFLGSFLGEYTLKELRESALKTEEVLDWEHRPRIFPFRDALTLTKILQSTGFRNIVVDKERLKLNYNNLFSLIKDIRRAGEKNMLISRQRTFLGKQFLLKLNEIYQNRFGDKDLRLPATLDLLHVFAQKY